MKLTNNKINCKIIKYDETGYGYFIIEKMINGTWAFNNCTGTTLLMKDKGYKVDGFAKLFLAKKEAENYYEKEINK